MSRSLRLRSMAAMFLSATVLGCGGGGGSDETAAAPPPAPVPPLAQPPIDISGTAAAQGIDHWGDNSTAQGGKGEAIDGIPCRVTDETYHIHSHLSIVLNGQLLIIPDKIGQVAATATTAGCFYQLHNHDQSGRLHVESPVPVTYTLGNLFHIWGQPLSRTNVGGITGMPIVFYVSDNGTTVRWDDDPATIPLMSHRLITIQIGSSLTALPNFTWTGT